MSESSQRRSHSVVVCSVLVISVLFAAEGATAIPARARSTAVSRIHYVPTDCPDSGVAANSLTSADIRHPFGAKGDGIADDTCPLVEAIAAVIPGGTIRIPRGLYRITRSVTVAKPLVLAGEGFYEDRSSALTGDASSVVGAWTKSFDGSAVWLAGSGTSSVTLRLAPPLALQAKIDARSSVTPSHPLVPPSSLHALGAIDLKDLLIIGRSPDAAPPLTTEGAQQQLAAWCANPAVAVGNNLGSPPIMHAHWENVRIVNAFCGLVLAGIEQSKFERIQVRAASLGLLVLPPSRDNEFYSTVVEQNHQIGIEVVGAPRQHFLSGTVQGASLQTTLQAPTWSDFRNRPPNPPGTYNWLVNPNDNTPDPGPQPPRHEG